MKLSLYIGAWLYLASILAAQCAGPGRHPPVLPSALGLGPVAPTNFRAIPGVGPFSDGQVGFWDATRRQFRGGTFNLAGTVGFGTIMATTSPAGIEMDSFQDGQVYIWWANPLNATPRRWALYTKADRNMGFFALWSNALARNVWVANDDGSMLFANGDPPMVTTKPLLAIGHVGLTAGNAAGTFFGISDSDATGADFADFQNNTGAVEFKASGSGQVYAGGDFVSLSNAHGTILQSPNGHFWRATISNAGVVTQTDLGTGTP